MLHKHHDTQQHLIVLYEKLMVLFKDGEFTKSETIRLHHQYVMNARMYCSNQKALASLNFAQFELEKLAVPTLSCHSSTDVQKKKYIINQIMAFHYAYIEDASNTHLDVKHQDDSERDTIIRLSRNLTTEEQDLLLYRPDEVSSKLISHNAVLLYVLLYDFQGKVKQHAWNAASDAIHFFISLPSDILNIIFQNLNLTDALHTRLVCHRWYANAFFIDITDIQSKAKRLLAFVFNGDRLGAEKYLKQISYQALAWNAILFPVSGEELCGRKWQSVSPLSFAAWIGDVAMMGSLLSFLPSQANPRALAQLRKVKEDSLEHSEHMAPFYSLLKMVEKFNIEWKALQSWDARTAFILEYIAPLQRDLSCFGLQWLCEKEIWEDSSDALRFHREPRRELRIFIPKDICFEDEDLDMCMIWNPFTDSEFQNHQAFISNGMKVREAWDLSEKPLYDIMLNLIRVGRRSLEATIKRYEMLEREKEQSQFINIIKEKPLAMGKLFRPAMKQSAKSKPSVEKRSSHCK